MKVVLVGFMFGHGGIQTHTHFLAQGLSARGHDVTVVSPPPPSGDLRPLRDDGNYRLEVYGGFADVLRGFSSCRIGVPDVAVVCGTGWKAMLGVLSLPTSTRKVFFEVMSGRRNGRMDPRILVHRGFDAIVGQASPVEERFCREFSWKDRRVTIPALPEPLELSVRIPDRENSLNSGEPLRLVYFGRLAAHKGVDYLLDNWDALAAHNAILDVYGSGPEENKLARIIGERSLSSKVRLLGSYPRGAECVALMQSYDIKLLPTSGDEGAPLVLLEAMACGLPFVANGVGGIPDYRNVDSRITTGDLAEFLPSVGDLIAARRQGRVDCQRLQAHYRRHFSFDSLVDRWEAFLAELVGSARGTQATAS
jgi:glycosyltransferase involved in cell wall biosynthesis